MFGWDKKFNALHVLSHLEAAAAEWLQEPGNPVFSKVPAGMQDALREELKQVELDAKAKIAEKPLG